jgi:small GTP-binding protein
MFEGRPERDAEGVFVGRSNVGKSTLLREITGHDFDTGSRPGVTRQPDHYDWVSEDFVITDMPGFGFMSGVPDQRQEDIKTGIVRYLEDHAEEILVAVLVLDAKSAVEIIDRHSGPDEVPHDVELFHFLRDLGIPTVVAANKMDKVDDRDARLDEICDRLGLVPPWQQHRDTIAPISAKRGSITPLLDAIGERLHEQHRDDLLKFF